MHTALKVGQHHLIWQKGHLKDGSCTSKLLDKVVAHLAVEFFHGHQVQRFQGVSRGSDEVQTSMDAGVMVVVQSTLDFEFLL